MDKSVRWEVYSQSLGEGASDNSWPTSFLLYAEVTEALSSIEVMTEMTVVHTGDSLSEAFDDN